MIFILVFSGLPSSSASIAYYKLSTAPSTISYILVIVGKKNVLQVNKTQTILEINSYLIKFRKCILNCNHDFINSLSQGVNVMLQQGVEKQPVLEVLKWKTKTTKMV